MDTAQHCTGELSGCPPLAGGALETEDVRNYQGKMAPLPKDIDKSTASNDCIEVYSQLMQTNAKYQVVCVIPSIQPQT